MSRWARLRHTDLLTAWRSAHISLDTGQPPSWFTGEATERYRSAAAVGRSTFTTGSATIDHVFHAMSEIGRGAHSDVQLADAFGIRLHNPFTDSQVIDAYLSVAPEALPSPSHYKPVMARAMSDLFPSRLLTRTTKGDSSRDHHQGLRDNLSFLTEFMDGRLHRLGLIDLPVFRKELAHAAAGMSAPLHHLQTAIAAEAWLRSLESHPVLWESP